MTYASLTCGRECVGYYREYGLHPTAMWLESQLTTTTRLAGPHIHAPIRGQCPETMSCAPRGTLCII